MKPDKNSLKDKKVESSFKPNQIQEGKQLQ